MASSRLTRRYAKALIELAGQQGKVEEVMLDVKEILKSIKSNRELALLFESPVIKPDTKIRVIEEIYEGKADPLTLAFIKIVINKRREPWLPNMLEAFIDEYHDLNGIIPVQVTTAIAMDMEFENELRTVLKEDFGISKIELSRETDENIIGGFVLKFEDKRYDASVKNMLDRIRKDLHKQVSIKIA